MDPIPATLPLDEHNRRLVSNVHPPDWVNPEPAPRYNMVVLGGGTAGLVCAAGAAGLGAKVALVERALLGGDCLNVGCVPSKCIIRSSRAVADVREAGAFGVNVPAGSQADFAAVMERMRRLRSSISDHDSAARFRDLGVDVFIGQARFKDGSTVEVDGRNLRFSRAVIATGAHAAHPPVKGLEEAGFLTNETVFSLTELPPRLAVIGAGPLGCELAQAFGRLGSDVTLLQRPSLILPREDADAAGIVAAALHRDGVQTVCDVELKRVEIANNTKMIHFESGGSAMTLVADAILVAAGRVPNVKDLGLEAAGVDYDPRLGVKVDDRLRTTNKHIFAAGDVCLRYKFTHTADASARIVIQNALFWGRQKASALTIPWCTYTDPEIAHVGMYEKDAHDAGLSIDTFTRSFADVDRAVADGEEEGLIKVHVKKGADRILGATIVARHAGEMISELTLAIVTETGLRKISGVIHPYPTQAEAIRQAADAYSQTRLTPRVKWLFQRLLAWRR